MRILNIILSNDMIWEYHQWYDMIFFSKYWSKMIRYDIYEGRDIMIIIGSLWNITHGNGGPFSCIGALLTQLLVPLWTWAEIHCMLGCSKKLKFIYLQMHDRDTCICIMSECANSQPISVMTSQSVWLFCKMWYGWYFQNRLIYYYVTATKMNLQIFVMSTKFQTNIMSDLDLQSTNKYSINLVNLCQLTAN